MAYSVRDLLSWLNDGPRGNLDAKVVNQAELKTELNSISVSGISNLSTSSVDSVSFFFSKEYQAELLHASPGILVTAPPFVPHLKAANLGFWSTSAVVSCENPYLALGVVSEKIAEGERAKEEESLKDTPAINPGAEIHQTAEISEGVRIGAGCVIDRFAKIGQGTVLYPGVIVGARVQIGQNCTLFPQVTLYDKTLVGDRVRIHAGAVLGSDGFGYAPVIKDGQVTGHQKIYHLGRVVVGNDVEIGANTCIDRGTFSDTVIEDQAVIDNLVQVGHNARVGQGSVLCGSLALAGRAQTGKFSYVGGLTGVVNRIKIGDYAKVGAMSLITKDVPAGESAVGNPQRTHKEHFKVHAALNKLARSKKSK